MCYFFFFFFFSFSARSSVKERLVPVHCYSNARKDVSNSYWAVMRKIRADNVCPQDDGSAPSHSYVQKCK